VKPVVLSRCLAASVGRGSDVCPMTCWTPPTHASLFNFFFFTSREAHAIISWELDRGVPLSQWHMSVSRVRHKKDVLTVRDNFWSKLRCFVKQTLAVLPVADWTVSFAFCLRHLQQCNGSCHHDAYHSAFSMSKKHKTRDCCTVP